MDIDQNIIDFAKRNGYDSVLPLGKWRGYDAYEPIFAEISEDERICTGPPLMVLVKGEEIRMSTTEEAYQQITEG